MSDLTPEVAAVLTEHGWHPDRDVAAEAGELIAHTRRTVGANGARHEPFPAAVAALGEFAGLYVMQEGTGKDLRRRPFAIDPAMAADTAETLAAFGGVLGSRLFPLGVEGDGEAFLAIDEQGRVFALDPYGEWFLGASMADALATLVAGALPARVRDDGTW